MNRWTERFNNDGEKAIAIHDGSDFPDVCFEGEREFNVMNALAEYEDLEEQGLLVRLPIEIGTELFQPCADRKSIIRSIVINNTITDDDIYIGIVDERGNERHYSKKSIGKTVFLTREEAEKELEEMKNE
jgi:hypothetical protein